MASSIYLCPSVQGTPYHVFVFLFPMHHISYFCALAGVGLWTINIHDRTTFRIPFVNGAAHHTVHHTAGRSRLIPG